MAWRKDRNRWPVTRRTYQATRSNSTCLIGPMWLLHDEFRANYWPPKWLTTSTSRLSVATSFIPFSPIMPFTTSEDHLLQLDSDGFDFTLPFEQLFFAIVPSALFIIASLWRLLSQSRKPKVVHTSTFQYIKLVCIVSHYHIAYSSMT